MPNNQEQSDQGEIYGRTGQKVLWRLTRRAAGEAQKVLVGHARFRLRAAAGLSTFLASCLAARLPLIGNSISF
jgi:hypothetical protein